MRVQVGFSGTPFWPERVEANLRLKGAGMGELPGWFHPDLPPDDFEEYQVWRQYKEDLNTLFRDHIRGVYDEKYTVLPAEQIRAAIQRGRDAYYARKKAEEASVPAQPKELPKKIERPGRDWLRDLGRIAPTDIPAEFVKKIMEEHPERPSLPPLQPLEGPCS